MRVLAKDTGVDPKTGRTISSGGSGTAFHFDGTHTYILTCRHVTNGAKGGFEVYFADGARAATFIAHDEFADLACLAVAGRATVIPIAETAPKTGQVFWQVGYPRGIGPTKRYGPLKDQSPFIQHPNGFKSPSWLFGFACDSGDSGSGIFSADQKLVAVLWGGGPMGTSAVGLGDISRFVETKCRPIFRRRPPPTGPPGAPPGAPPVSPEGPPPAPEAPRIDLSEVWAQIADIREALKGKTGAEVADGLGKRLDDLAAKLDRGAALVPELLKPIRKEIEEARKAGLIADDKARRIGDALGKVEEDVGSVRDKVLPGIVDRIKGIAEIGAGFPWGTLITGLASGTGGAGLALVLGRWVLSRGVQRVRERRQQAQAPAAGSGMQAAPMIVDRPIPGELATQQSYVAYQAPSKEAEARRLALEKYKRENPQSSAPEVLEEFYKQILSGLPK